VRQLLARIDDDLHRRLKQRAAVEGRSMNAMISDILRRAVVPHDQRELVRARLRALGRLADVPPPRKAPSRAAALRLARGTGSTVSDALAAERRRR
jgi:plasmid stability protein